MRIHNQKTVNAIKMFLIRLPFFATVLVLVAQLLGWIDLPVVLIGLAILTGLCILATLILKMHFVEVLVKDGHLYVRFYHLFPLIREYRMVEVPAGQLIKAEIKPSVFGLTEVLFLTVNTTKGIAVFPELPLTLFNSTQREELFRMIQTCL